MRRFVFAMVALVMSMQVMFANVGVDPHVDSPSPVSDVKEGYMISGHVIEKDTEENIPYATVLIEKD